MNSVLFIYKNGMVRTVSPEAARTNAISLEYCIVIYATSIIIGGPFKPKTRKWFFFFYVPACCFFVIAFYYRETSPVLVFFLSSVLEISADIRSLLHAKSPRDLLLSVIIFERSRPILRGATIK